MVCPITQGDHKEKPQGKNIMACPIIQGGHNKCSTAAEVSDRLAAIDMDRKLGGSAPPPFGEGELSPHLTQCDQGLLPYQVAFDPSSRLATTNVFRKLVENQMGIQLPSSNTMWPRPRSTSVPNGILIHPIVWPQYTNVNITLQQLLQSQCGSKSSITYAAVLDQVMKIYFFLFWIS